MAQTARKTKTKTKIALRKKAKLPKHKVTKRTAKTKKTKTAKRTTNATRTTAQTRPTLRLAERPRIVGVGNPAPNFTLPNTTGTPVTLSNYRGKRVVLYFYPKDDTPGCTKEACSFRDNIESLQNDSTILLGVSSDGQESHKKFTAKYSLNFPLLSDIDHTVAKAYGCWILKNMYGNKTWGIQRSTFVIDREGKIAATYRGVNVDGHTQEVKEALLEID
jgi:thioredoxin-dependent peroxiredoxin